MAELPRWLAPEPEPPQLHGEVQRRLRAARGAVHVPEGTLGSLDLQHQSLDELASQSRSLVLASSMPCFPVGHLMHAARSGCLPCNAAHVIREASLVLPWLLVGSYSTNPSHPS